MTTTAKILCTAKIRCTGKTPISDGQTRLSFSPDYSDGRNAEWAKNTPSLGLTMTVLDQIAARYKDGEAITLLFTVEDDDQAED